MNTQQLFTEAGDAEHPTRTFEAASPQVAELLKLLRAVTAAGGLKVAAKIAQHVTWHDHPERPNVLVAHTDMPLQQLALVRPARVELLRMLQVYRRRDRGQQPQLIMLSDARKQLDREDREDGTRRPSRDTDLPIRAERQGKAAHSLSREQEVREVLKEMPSLMKLASLSP